jgi:hypothetical protein
MKRAAIFVAIAIATLVSLSCDSFAIGSRLRVVPGGKVIDHSDANVDGISAARIAKANGELVVAYWHTSHGSQLFTGISGMDAFYGNKGWYLLNEGGGLPLSEPGGDIGSYAGDLNDSIANFQQDVRNYLNANPATNVVMASWCGQVSGATQENISNYLARMSALESEYANVTFVYMTGHADGTGLQGNLHKRDQQIRDYCVANGKWLFDFYDIECYDPDGAYYGGRYVTDGCNYDYNNSGGTTQSGDPAEPTNGDRNWASDWQAAHPGQWWSCSAAHSKPLNGNQKAKAVWQLWCAVAESM